MFQGAQPQHDSGKTPADAQQPTVQLPSGGGLRELVKGTLCRAMDVPGFGGLVRALAAEQTVFPNFRIDQLTHYALERLLTPDNNCIDVGAHTGSITDIMLQFAPRGRHWAIEALPEYSRRLEERFKGNSRVTIVPCAVSDAAGRRDFVRVRNFPGFSGFANRTFTGAEANTEHLEVEVKTLDDLIPPGLRVDVIKLDIEGAELNALRGAQRILNESFPALILEFQNKAAPYFGCTPTEMFHFLQARNYHIRTLDGWLNETRPLNLGELWDRFEADPNLYLLCCNR